MHDLLQEQQAALKPLRTNTQTLHDIGMGCCPTLDFSRHAQNVALEFWISPSASVRILSVASFLLRVCRFRAPGASTIGLPIDLCPVTSSAESTAQQQETIADIGKLGH